jgi:hypothetical protein
MKTVFALSVIAATTVVVQAAVPIYGQCTSILYDFDRDHMNEF